MLTGLTSVLDDITSDPYANSSASGGIVNRTLGARYEILESLGDGPLLAAYRARDRQANRIVTIKTLLPRFQRRPDLVSAIKEGVGQSLALNHHAIARVLDVGEDDATGTLYLAEEYVQGVDLRERLRRSAPLQLAAATDVALSLAEALEAAHARNLTHGDVRPQNILSGQDRQAKLTNFGLANAVHRAGNDAEVMKRVVSYTAPEAARAAAPTPSADLYALGVVLWEMLTGTLPYTGDNPMQVALKHAQEPIPSVRAVNSGIPPALDGILTKSLGKTPQERYPNATELLRDLRQVRDGLRYGKSLTWSPMDRAVTPPVAAVPIPAPVPASAAPSIEEATIAPATVVATTAAATAATVPPPPAEAGQRATLTVREPETGRTLAFSDPAPSEVEEKPMSYSRSGGLRWLTALIVLGLVMLACALGFLAITVRNMLRPTNEIVLPNFVGKPLDDAKKTAELQKFGLSVVDEEYRDKEAKGVIFKMGESAGRTIKEGRQVPVWVSKGPRLSVVPDVSGLTFEKARGKIEAAGLRVGDAVRQYDALAPEGTVTAQKPSVGEDEPRGTPVTLTVSKGEEPTPTPEPIPTPEPYDPNAYHDNPARPTPDATPTPDTQNLTPRYFRFQYPVPADGASHRIRVDVSDDTGPHTVFDEPRKGGETVVLKQLEALGNKVSVKVFDNDELKTEKQLPPPR